MSEYIVTSGSHLVTKNGAALGGSPFASDQAALQAAHDDAADADTINMVQFDRGTKFEFLLAEQLIASKAVIFQGEGADKTSIVGGTNAVYFDGAGKNATFKNFKLENSTERGLFVKNAADVLIDGVKIETDTAYGRYGTNPNEIFLGAQVGNSPGGDTYDAVISGNVELRGVECDLETAMSPDDPYAGNLQKNNPAEVSQGGAWPGSGQENPEKWRTMCIAVGMVPANKKALFKDCIAKNYSYYGITAIDNFGHVEMSGCLADTYYGGHDSGLSSGSYGINFTNASSKLIDYDTNVGKPHGRWNAFNNNVILRGRRLGGYLMYQAAVPGRAINARCVSNVVDAKLYASYGWVVYGFDFGQFLRNVSRGSGYAGWFVGSYAPSATNMTRFCHLIGNDFSEWDSFYRDVWLTTLTEGCLVAPAGSLDKIADQGVDNILFGRS